MTSSISKYFASKTNSNKRRPSSTSSDNCSSPTDFHPSDSKKQDKKKQRLVTELSQERTLDMEDMEELKTNIECIKEKLTFVCMKEDIQVLREEMAKISETLTRRVDVLEGSLFDLQKEMDRLSEEVNQLKKDNTSLRSQLETTRRESRELRGVQNDNEQHGRLWNVRVHGVKETQRPTEETAADCVQKCVQVFSQRVGVSVRPEDIEIAHRSGRPRIATGDGAANRTRPILVRFFSRQKKAEVLQNIRKLKQTGLSVSEDLTAANFRLLKQAADHSATMSAWSANGKIRVIAKLKNGATIRLTVGTGLNEQIMSKI